MTKARDDVLAANKAHATDFGDKANLPMPPARRFAILTCMDARLDPAKFAGECSAQGLSLKSIDSWTIPKCN